MGASASTILTLATHRVVYIHPSIHRATLVYNHEADPTDVGVRYNLGIVNRHAERWE
jgi:hypothetical protein